MTTVRALRAEGPVCDLAAEPRASGEVFGQVQVLQVVRLVQARYSGEKRALYVGQPYDHLLDAARETLPQPSGVNGDAKGPRVDRACGCEEGAPGTRS